MFFDSLDEITLIARKNGTSIFVLPKNTEYKIKNALILEPKEKATITIDQIREIIAKLSVKQLKDQYIIIRPAELMNKEASNALLKNLEEPGDKVHFILITSSPSSILPTILSRSSIYFLKTTPKQEIDADARVKELAKKLMVAKGKDLIVLAEEITKKKDGVRAYALEIIGAAIEMLYKTYLINGKDVFLLKLPKFLKLYENISKNGHIKLHLVSDLI